MQIHDNYYAPVLHENGYQITIMYGDDVSHLEDDNVDVYVEIENGDTYVGTFVSIANVHSLMKKFQKTGECCHGLYLWISDMIIVQDCTQDVIRKTIADLVQTNELACALLKVEDQK